MVRTVISVVCIIILISLLTIGENIIVDKYCDKLAIDVNAMKNSVEHELDISEDIASVIDEWQNKKNVIYIFTNHNNFEEIESSIYNIEYFYSEKNITEAEFQIDTLHHRVEELRESLGLSLGNLL